eukprot:384137-Pyramimonas_sp.AAC.1
MAALQRGSGGGTSATATAKATAKAARVARNRSFSQLGRAKPGLELEDIDDDVLLALSDRIAAGRDICQVGVPSSDWSAL